MHKPFDLDKIRTENPIPQFLERRHHELKDTGRGGFRSACPIHTGKNKLSFWVHPNGLTFCCHSCGAKGGIIDLVMALDRVDFKLACESLGAVRIESDSTIHRRQKAPPQAKPAPLPVVLPELDQTQADEMERMIERLRKDEPLRASIAESRGWNPVTLEALTYPSCTSPRGDLGWKDGCLAFIYGHSVKLRPLYRDSAARGGWRWHKPDGSKSPWWNWSGWPWNARELWREDRINSTPFPRDAVLIAEGEPDVISCLDDFMETPFRAVMGIPTAKVSSELLQRLPTVLRGLDVRFMADTDQAGKSSIPVLTEALRGAVILKLSPLPKAA